MDANRSYEIQGGWDENERITESRGRVYFSTAPRRIWLCRLLEGGVELDGQNFDRRRDAVACGTNWIDAD